MEAKAKAEARKVEAAEAALKSGRLHTTARNQRIKIHPPKIFEWLLKESLCKMALTLCIGNILNKKIWRKHSKKRWKIMWISFSLKGDSASVHRSIIHGDKSVLFISILSEGNSLDIRCPSLAGIQKHEFTENLRGNQRAFAIPTRGQALTVSIATWGETWDSIHKSFL